MQKILIVDDEAGIRKLIEAILTEEGYEVHLASNGYQALEVLEKGSFKLAILDVKLPGINGIDVLKRIRGSNSSIRIIMMTAYEELDFNDVLKEHGVYGSIAKPFDIKEIRDLVSGAMDT
ncbi:response regulator [Geomicrobium sp. JCM 19039]|uniref:response regulator n=1 Tax=Geomicrobium sp. JCM 19039 TaxID=1460636 RepID=UPI00045F125F|nr:response regulator [Geomicrobium sp. JCM 19039]GAK14462.1 sporulation initiation phosphotransferase [Geomicrobium sp. JCM 19039]